MALSSRAGMLLSVWLLAGLAPAGANEPNRPEAARSEVSRYEARVNALLSSPETWQKARQDGKKAAFFCANCHGEAGVSTLGHVPNLAGQNPVYLMTQIQKFGDGRRRDDFMSGLIKVLKEEDRLNMAIYYGALDVRPTPAKNPRLAREGQLHYRRACLGCHGQQARGGRDIARLAGQQKPYLMDSLKKYRSRAEGRSDRVMSSIAAKLNDEQIESLAEYLSSLP